jgi:anti-anti-sigma factor
MRIDGELDLAAEEPLADLLRTLSREEDTHRMVVDLRKVTFLDSVGLRFVLSAEMRSRRDGFAFAVVPPRGYARKTLEASGVDRLITLVDERSAAGAAAERASGGIGTEDDDPSDWLAPDLLHRKQADEIF